MRGMVCYLLRMKLPLDLLVLQEGSKQVSKSRLERPLRAILIDMPRLVSLLHTPTIPRPLLGLTTGEFYIPHDFDDEPEGKWLELPDYSTEDGSDVRIFLQRLSPPRVADALAQAFTGKGAFRKFKQALRDYPEVQTHWEQFKTQQEQRRALRWLEGLGLTPAESI